MDSKGVGDMNNSFLSIEEQFRVHTDLAAANTFAIRKTF
jgi:hypothetical protein